MSRPQSWRRVWPIALGFAGLATLGTWRAEMPEGDGLASPWQQPDARLKRVAISEGRALDTGHAIWALGDERGKIVLVNEMATWCGPCRSEAPTLARLRARFLPQEVAMIGLLWDEGSDASVAEAERRFEQEVGGVPYPMRRAIRDPLTSFAGVALPTTLLIDRKGRLVRSYTGAITEETVIADIERLKVEPDSR